MVYHAADRASGTQKLKKSGVTTLDLDTIVAIATPPGSGGVGIVRISGALAGSIGRVIFGDASPTLEPRLASLRSFMAASGEVLDSGLALWFPAPGSFTGEDVLELHGHGGPVVMNMLLKRVLSCGARLARPGEFTERAFLNDKLDLVQAEAIADLINSATETAALAAQKSLAGDFSNKIKELENRLLELRVFVEAAIDFPDEEVDFLAEGEVAERVAKLVDKLHQLLDNTRSGIVLRDGIRLVLAGKPNVGKSSLLNRLAGHDRAIVTPLAGTTRDTIRETLDLDGLAVDVVDTAGLRQASDAIEREGVSRTLKEVAVADLVLLLTDDAPEGHGTAMLSGEEANSLKCELLPEIIIPNDRFVFVRNKIDLFDGEGGVFRDASGNYWVNISVMTGDGVDTLIQVIRDRVGFAPTSGMFTARERHLNALNRAGEALERGKQQLSSGVGGELLAEDLKTAHAALGEILGEVSSDALLGEIFSSFCIGK